MNFLIVTGMSGAGKSSVELMIIRAVAAVTGLPTDKISVLPGK